MRVACEGAPGSIAELAATVERMVIEKRSARQIAAAARAFADHAVAARTDESVWLSSGSREWLAWECFYRSSKGRAPTQDKRGGWRFPTRWPPGYTDSD
ncbi:hypothetical protein WOC76_05520 [Methylocystis sp. IM3]|uniref:hypothetical protein n=1 Tax=unclassified Methylocystis TaxID=2625913 RepID=UPI0030F810FD